MPDDQHSSTFLSHRHFEAVKSLMRHSSLNLQLVAQGLRNTYEQKFKNIARAKALKKGLSINIERAKGCPQTAVSVIPLPILDTAPSPLVIAIPPTSDQLRHRRHPHTPVHSNIAVSSLVPRILSPLSASVFQVAHLPATPFNEPVQRNHRPVLPRLDIPTIPTISVSYFSVTAINEKASAAVSITYDDALYGYAPAAPAVQVKELPDVPVDADYWEDMDMSLSSRSSSSGPETPCDSEDESPFMIRIRKRKTIDEDEELRPKHIMKKRWSTCSNARGRSSRRKAIYMTPTIVTLS